MPPNLETGIRLGNVLKERQGTGYSTVLNSGDMPNFLLNLESLNLSKERMAEQKRQRLAAARQKMYEKNPDYFYRHDAQIQGKLTELIEKGGELFADGVNPWESATDPRAIEWQKKNQEINRLANASSQVKGNFIKYQSQLLNPANADKIANRDEIAAYFDNPDVESMIGTLPPEIKWKDPTVSLYKETNKMISEWGKANKDGVLDAPASLEMAKGVSADEGMFSYNSQMRQKYKDHVASLPEDERSRYDTKGAENGVDGYTQYLADHILNSVAPVNLTDMFMGTKVNLRESTVVRDGKKIRVKKYDGGKKGLEKIVRSKIEGYEKSVMRDVSAGLYGDPNKDVSHNKKEAIDYYTNLMDENLAKLYSETPVGGDGGIDTTTSVSNWVADITSNDMGRVQSAIEFVLSNKDFKEGIGISTSSTIIGVAYPDPFPTEEPDFTEKVTLKVVNKDGEESLIRVDVDRLAGEIGKNAVSNETKANKRGYGTDELGNSVNTPIVQKGKYD